MKEVNPFNERARCERLAQLGGIVQHGDAFMMGMFSLLDALIDCPFVKRCARWIWELHHQSIVENSSGNSDVLVKKSSASPIRKNWAIGTPLTVWREIYGVPAAVVVRIHRIDAVGRTPAAPCRRLNPVWVSAHHQGGSSSPQTVAALTIPNEESAIGNPFSNSGPFMHN